MRLLKLDAEPLTEVALVRIPPAAEHFDIACVGLGKPLADLDRRRLAGAIGTKEAEALAGTNGEVEAIDGDDITVGFTQTRNA